MENKQKSSNIEFFVFNREKKQPINRQREKFKELGQISHICLRKNEGKTSSQFFKCVQEQAERNLS